MTSSSPCFRPTVHGIGIACVATVLIVFLTYGAVYKLTSFQPATTGSRDVESIHWSNFFRTRVDTGSDGEGSGFDMINNRKGSERESHKTLKPQSCVVYNRVGKCGSRAVIAILRKLAVRNGFTYHGSVVHNRTHMSLKEQMELVNNISAFEAPFIYQRHFHYIDFQKFGALQPVYFNVIRDPVNRFVSGYYFKRFGDDISSEKYLARPMPDRNVTIDECVLSQKEECSEKKMFYIVPFFCGQHEFCSQPSQIALDRAVFNLDQNFLVVGFIERLRETLQVLERILPDMFEGSVEILDQQDKSEKHNGRSSRNKIPPSNNVRNTMQKMMRYEYEFYEIALKRFDYTKKKLGIR